MRPKTSNARKTALPLLATLLPLLLAAMLSTAALAGDLRAYFDRTSVYEGDTVTLVIETTGGALGQPNLSGLGADFDLLGTSRSTNISIVNGKRTDTVRLLITLVPRRMGSIAVAPIQVGSERTGTLELQVSEVPKAGSGGGGDDIFVEMEIGSESGTLMVQQQVSLTVRLFTAVPVIQGNLESPRADGALVTKLGEDRRYDTRRNGRDYQVVERRYSLSPERSGELRIPPVRFEGRLRTNQGRRGESSRSLFDDPFFDRFFQNSPLSRDPFGMLDRGKRVSARSRAIALDVKARPEGYAGDHWLPARELEIVDSWAENPPEPRVGEPVTRTLTLQAKGLSGPQIPEIEIPATPGLRAYPEKTGSETHSDGETVYGISRQGLTLIPTQAGELTIPEIRVTWWDTDAQHERIAIVPGWSLTVTGEARTGAKPEADPAPTADHEAAGQVNQEAGGHAPTDSLVTWLDRLALIGGGSLLALLLVAATVWGLGRQRRSQRDSGPARRPPIADLDGLRLPSSKARKALRLACEANDAPAAAKALLDWADTTWPGDAPRNLGSLHTRLPRGADRVRELERALYAPATSGHWNGAALWRALRGGMSDAPIGEQGQAGTLEPLYPRRS